MAAAGTSSSAVNNDLFTGFRMYAMGALAAGNRLTPNAPVQGFEINAYWKPDG